RPSTSTIAPSSTTSATTTGCPSTTSLAPPMKWASPIRSEDWREKFSINVPACGDIFLPPFGRRETQNENCIVYCIHPDGASPVGRYRQPPGPGGTALCHQYQVLSPTRGRPRRSLCGNRNSRGEFYQV